MSHRKILGTLVVIITLLFGIGLSLMYPNNIGLCSIGERCVYDSVFYLWKPLLFSLIPVLLVLILFLFLSDKFFNIWWKFALVYFILAFLWISTTPIMCRSLICFDREYVAIVSGVGFLIVSFIIIITKTVLLRRKKI